MYDYCRIMSVEAWNFRRRGEKVERERERERPRERDDERERRGGGR